MTTKGDVFIKSDERRILFRLLLANILKPEVLVIIILLFTLKPFAPNNYHYIQSDGVSYYTFLPATFIYKDLSLGFVDEIFPKHYKPEEMSDPRRVVEGKTVNITFVGTSILMLPFFILAHFVTHLTNYPTDGYSLPYQLSVLIAAMFYLWLGLWALRKLLEIYVSEKWITYAILIPLTFATPLFYYTISASSFSHVYSFALILIFLLYTKRLFLFKKSKYLIYCTFTLALIGIVRPTNSIVILLIPFLAGSFKTIKETITWVFVNNSKLLAILFVGFVAILSIQPIIYFIQTGKPFVWSYQGGSFNFNNPHFLDYLFSYKKGLFFYSPFLLFALPGFWGLLKRSKFEGISLLLFVSLTIYILASWWSWWFGMSFGQRSAIDFLGVYGLLIGIGLWSIRGSFYKSLFIVLTTLFITLNFIQAYQYHNYIFYWDLDKLAYQKAFLRTSTPYQGRLWRRHKLTDRFKKFNNDYPLLTYEEHKDFEGGDGKTLGNCFNANTGIYSLSISESDIFAATTSIDYGNFNPDKSYAIIADISSYPLEYNIAKPYFFVLQFVRNEETTIWNAINSHNAGCIPEWWRKMNISQDLPAPMAGDIIKVFIWNVNSTRVIVDDLYIQIRAKK